MAAHERSAFESAKRELDHCRMKIEALNQDVSFVFGRVLLYDSTTVSYAKRR